MAKKQSKSKKRKPLRWVMWAVVDENHDLVGVYRSVSTAVGVAKIAGGPRKFRVIVTEAP